MTIMIVGMFIHELNIYVEHNCGQNYGMLLAQTVQMTSLITSHKGMDHSKPRMQCYGLVLLAPKLAKYCTINMKCFASYHTQNGITAPQTFLYYNEMFAIHMKNGSQCCFTL